MFRKGQDLDAVPVPDRPRTWSQATMSGPKAPICVYIHIYTYIYIYTCMRRPLVGQGV